jgi:hypothetical protein
MVVRHSWRSPVCFAWGYGGQLSAPLEAFDLVIVVTVDPLHGQQGMNHGKPKRQTSIWRLTFASLPSQ